jgi:hypothetical protein
MGKVKEDKLMRFLRHCPLDYVKKPCPYAEPLYYEFGPKKYADWLELATFNWEDAIAKASEKRQKVYCSTCGYKQQTLMKLREDVETNLKSKNQWYFGKHAFWRWIVEKVLRKKWIGMPSYAMHYLDTLSEEEKEKLRKQWLKEMGEYIQKLKQKDLLY